MQWLLDRGRTPFLLIVGGISLFLGYHCLPLEIDRDNRSMDADDEVQKALEAEFRNTFQESDSILLAVHRASSSVLVKAAKMDTGNKKRDVEMRKSLDVDTYPEFRVSVKDLAPEATNPRLEGEVPQPTVIPFVLSLKGKTHKITARVTGWAYAKDNISCTVTFPVSLAAAGIKPPSVPGLVKVKDELVVTAKLSPGR